MCSFCKCKSYSHFFSKNISVYAKFNDQSFNNTLTNSIISFEQLGPEVQYNLNGSNTDGSFTMDDSNSFFSPYKILPIAQENEHLGIFSYFIMELYVVCTY